MNSSATYWMRRALELAEQGQGAVEPNPLVGCVIVRDEQAVGEGWHAKFGGQHAEVAALAAAGEAARDATIYVTLEPCCHHGKTPPCTKAIIDAGLASVIIAMRDPFPKVDGGGIAELEQAGMEVEIGVLEQAARSLNAPYLKLVATGRPWIIAKWAMSLDGKIATHSGQSRWISGEASRKVVHELRGRVDAIMVGSRTAALDDPLLTARPPGPRVATRIVVDSAASLSPQSKLAQTTADAPVLVAASSHAPEENRTRLERAGCEVLALDGATHADRLGQLLDELGRRGMTNVLVEGGGQLLGSLWHAGQIDEVHAFIAPKLIGGADAPSPLWSQRGASEPNESSLGECQIKILGDDVYVRGRVSRDGVSN
jgi:diaminohydroxyphosphoribosylaminopyrimidine deaminase/5-amino-6-(5-phosphoribosylamino)uracil reductase